MRATKGMTDRVKDAVRRYANEAHRGRRWESASITIVMEDVTQRPEMITVYPDEAPVKAPPRRGLQSPSPSRGGRGGSS